MNTPLRWNTSSAHLSTLNGKWKEIQRGLRLVGFGYCSLLLFTVPGLLLLWLSQGQRTAWLFDRPEGFNRQYAQLVGLCVAGLGLFFWYCLLLAGQWNCLTYSPQRYAAKELLFICALCLALGPTSLVTAHFLGGTNPEVLFTEGLSVLIRYPEAHATLLLQTGGALLIVLNLVMFSGFMRAVGKCLNGDQGAAPIVRYLWFVAFLLGATLGMLWTPHSEVLIGLASGWVIALIWNVILINYASRLIIRILPNTKEAKAQPVEAPRPRPYSGLHRYYVHVKPQ